MAAGVTRHREPGFSEPVNLTPTPPGGPIPQAQLHRGDSNTNFHKASRITTVGHIQSRNLNGSTDSGFSSAPTLRAPRPAGSPGTEGGNTLSRRQPSPRPRVGRAHTQTRPLPQTQSPEEGGAACRHSFGDPPAAARAAASGRERPPGAVLLPRRGTIRTAASLAATKPTARCSKCGL